MLNTEDLGSLNIGSLVFYRHIIAGQVVGYAMNPGGNGVTLTIFINAPFDSYVTGGTRFWQASGVDMSITSDGVKLRTESLTSILQGGIAFQSLPGVDTSTVPADTAFTLNADQDRAMRPIDTETSAFVMYFKGSLRGLSAGCARSNCTASRWAKCKSVDLEYDPHAGALRFPVIVDLYPQRIRGRRTAAASRSAGKKSPDSSSRALFDSLVAHGMRAELKVGNLLTGQQYVDLDMHPDAPAEKVWWNEQLSTFPTVSNGLDEIQDSIATIARKLVARSRSTRSPIVCSPPWRPSSKP